MGLNPSPTHLRFRRVTVYKYPIPRPKSDNPKAVLGIRLEPDTIARVGQLARRAGTTKSEMAARLIRAGLAGGEAPARAATAPKAAGGTEREAWIRRRAVQLANQGRTTPVAVREATREWEARGG